MKLIPPSRKLRLTLTAMLLIAGGGVLGAFMAPFAPLYGTFVGGIIGALSVYAGANVVQKKLANTKDYVEGDGE